MFAEVNTTEEVLPSVISEAAAAAVADLLPSKSKDRYEKEYAQFEEWCRAKNVHDIITEDVLLAFFLEKATAYKSSSLWSIYSMLKSTLIVKKNVNISKFHRLISYLKKQSQGYTAKKSRTLSRAEIDKFLLQAPDNNFLLMKVTRISHASFVKVIS